LESEAAKQFLAAAQEVDDYRFGISADAEVLKQYEVTADAVLVLKKVRHLHLIGFPLLTNVFLYFKFDDGKAVLDKDITSSAIVGFVRTESLPLVIEFTHESAQKIFSGEIKNHLLIFVGKSAADAEKITGAAREAAKEHKGKVSTAHYASPTPKITSIMAAGFVRDC